MKRGRVPRIINRLNRLGDCLDRWFLVIAILILFFVLGLWLWVDVSDAADCPSAVERRNVRRSESWTQSVCWAVTEKRIVAMECCDLGEERELARRLSAEDAEKAQSRQGGQR